MYKLWKKEEPYMVLENKIIRTPITEEKTKELKAGDYVNNSGTIYKRKLRKNFVPYKREKYNIL